jgi:hypothetical protein
MAWLFRIAQPKPVRNHPSHPHGFEVSYSYQQDALQLSKDSLVIWRLKLIYEMAEAHSRFGRSGTYRIAQIAM